MSPNSCSTHDPNVRRSPNAGFLKYAPGASFPLHRHDFAQVWYIIEGEFTFAGKLYGPGTIAYMAPEGGLAAAAAFCHDGQDSPVPVIGRL